MDFNKPAKKPAKIHRSPDFYLSPIIPRYENIGHLKDIAQEIVAASATLEGKVAKETAFAIGDQLRLINSYYSNLIEGHKTTIPEIAEALQQNFSKNPEKQYAQELCAAHVETEKHFMSKIDTNLQINICEPSFLSDLHASFYAHLPHEHRYTHTHEGFTKASVTPGKLRDVNVSVDGLSFHGPDHSHLPALIKTFAKVYDPNRFHGDERLIAMAASHHRLTWLHPFRDGNGRTARLFSGIYLAGIGINRTNLWSLSRGLSRDKKRYMFELWATDSPGGDQSEFHFDDELLVSFCEFFFEICLDQIRFMDALLKLDQIDSRIDWYIETRAKNSRNPLHPASSKLLRAVFMRGALSRGKAAGILNMSDRNARRIVSTLLQEGLLQSPTHRTPLTIGLPINALPYYFPDLYEPAVIGFNQSTAQ